MSVSNDDDDEYDEYEDGDDVSWKDAEPPEKGPFGTRSSQRQAFAVLDGSTLALSVGDVVDALPANAGLLGALYEVARSKTVVAMLEGSVWIVAPSSWDGRTGEPDVGPCDRVNVVDARIVSSHRYEDVVEAWLRGLLRVAEDPVLGDATILETTPESFGAALVAWKGWMLTIADAALEELQRPAVPQSTRPVDLAGLFARAREGDREASRHLEDEAWRLRDLTLYRFARATTDGRAAVARILAARVRLG